MRQFEKVVAVGGTGLLYQVLEAVQESGTAGELLALECNAGGIKRETGIPCRKAGSKPEVMRILEAETADTLVLSVMNPYLFTQDVLEKENLLVINLHHALLPKHRGRNAECWAIYEGDETAGITWHKVNAGVDTGDIYLQKKVAVAETDTALRLLTALNAAALEGIRELLRADIKHYPLQPQDKAEPSVLHMAKDVPNGGWLDLEWDAAHMSRFLRAVDYGVLDVFEKPRLRLDGTVYGWKGYRIAKAGPGADGISREGDSLRIQKDGLEIRLTKMTER